MEKSCYNQYRMTAEMWEVADTLGEVVKNVSEISGNSHGASLY